MVVASQVHTIHYGGHGSKSLTFGLHKIKWIKHIQCFVIFMDKTHKMLCNIYGEITIHNRFESRHYHMWVVFFILKTHSHIQN